MVFWAYAPYQFIDTEQEFEQLVRDLIVED